MSSTLLNSSLRRRLTPPKGFVPAGEVIRVEISPEPLFAKAPRKRGGRRGEGIRYERRVQAYLAEQHDWRYLASPWFKFWRMGGHEAWCQPDGLLFNFELNTITIVEVKLQHTIKAWWQLRRLYEPVVRIAFPNWRLLPLEVVNFCDPHIPFPEPVNLLPQLVPANPAPEAFHLHVLSKRALALQGYK